MTTPTREQMLECQARLREFMAASERVQLLGVSHGPQSPECLEAIQQETEIKSVLEELQARYGIETLGPGPFDIPR